MRTLYLDGSKRVRVIQDGPALRVRQHQVGDRLFPLRHLIQVIVNGPVEWATNALLACAEASVPVVFLRADGSLRGRVVGDHKSDPLLEINLTLETFLEQPERVDRYHAWISAKLQQARLGLLRATGWRAPPSDLKTVRQFVERRGRLYARASDLRRFDRQLHALLLANADQLLREVRLDPDNTIFSVQGINITRDFTNILFWTIQKEKLQYLKQLRKLALRNGDAFAELDWLRAVQFIEWNKMKIAGIFEAKFRQFHVYLLDIIRSHDNQ